MKAIITIIPHTLIANGVPTTNWQLPTIEVPCTDASMSEDSGNVLILPSSKTALLHLRKQCESRGLYLTVDNNTGICVVNSHENYLKLQVTRGKWYHPLVLSEHVP